MFLTLITIGFSKQETLTMFDGDFEGLVYSGNIENGKLNGQGKMYCQKIPDRVFLDGEFVNNEFVSGKLNSCNINTYRDEIKFGNLENTKYKDESSTRLQYEISGDFRVKDKKNPELFNDNLDITYNFFNTQFYDKFVGKTYINVMTYDREEMAKGTLYLKNNRIKEITAMFYISNLFFGEGQIVIKGDNFVLDGFTSRKNEINEFYFDGVVRWDDNTEYYITDARFKRDLIEKLDNWKKLSTPIKNPNVENKGLNTVDGLKNEVSINNGKNLNINTNGIEYTNDKVYKQNDKTIDLERK